MKILYFDLERGSQTLGNQDKIQKMFGLPMLAPSTYDAFEKIHNTDSFGYVTQGYGYGLASDTPFKGWIAVNKSTGQIAVAEAPSNDEYKEKAKNE